MGRIANSARIVDDLGALTLSAGRVGQKDL
jgi:hypothetical protein